MGKLMVRKIVVAVICAVLMAVVATLVFPALVSGLQTADGVAVTAAGLLDIPGMMAFVIVMGAVGGVVSFVSAQLSPSRRRRFRSSGTVVEDDVEDGRERGVVKWFNVKKGFGFITWDQGEDVFVHFRSIRGQGHRSLTEGQRVKFAVVRGQKGPQAEDVSAVR